jgi:hypothetical protein
MLLAPNRRRTRRPTSSVKRGDPVKKRLDSFDVSLVGLLPAKIPVGIDFLAMPFGEPMLFRIASAYERATRHRMSPPEFGSLEEKK